jgi:ABC-2 type transport system ATP-binding protein
MHVLLSIENLCKTFTNMSFSVIYLNNVNVTIYKGEIFGLLGVIGAGKTTLSSIIATLHPPTSGDIKYKGSSIYKNLMEYRQIMGFCPQYQNLDSFLTVRENLEYAGRYFLMDEKTIKERVDELMEQLELTKYATFSIDALSGGTKQRVLIARALIPSPEIVILDEPTVGLDPDIRKKLWQLILDLKKRGITVILTTHYLDEAEALSDRVCILHKGTMQLVESVATLKERHAQASLEEIFLKLVEDYQSETER